MASIIRTWQRVHAELLRRLDEAVPLRLVGGEDRLPRRLKVRYERRSDIHLAFLTLACIKVCFYRLYLET